MGQGSANNNRTGENLATISAIHNLSTTKATLVDADEICIQNSASSFSIFRTTFLNLYTSLKTKFDSVYQTVLVSGSNIKTLNGSSLLGSSNLQIIYSLFDFFNDVTVGGIETDIFSSSLIANTFAVNKDKVVAIYGGNFVTAGTQLTQLKVIFSGTTIWDSTAVAPSTGTTSWKIIVDLIRKSSTAVLYTVTLNTTGASGYVYCKSGELTGLTLTNINILKITGVSSGVSSGIGDIVGKQGTVDFKPAS